MDKLVVYVSGCSGVGKNTVINSLIESGESVKFLVSYTTRTKRDFEIAEKQYHFVDKVEFEKLIANKKILEFDEYNDNYYGHCLDSIDDGLQEVDAVIKDLTVGGVKKSLENIGAQYHIVPIFLTERKDVIRHRLEGRGEKQIKQRLKVYKKEHKMVPYFKYVVRNDNIDDTLRIVKAILKLEHKNEYLAYGGNIDSINQKRIDKYCLRLMNNKKLPKISAVLNDKKLVLVDNVEGYIASIVTGKNTPVYISKIVDTNIDVANNTSWKDFIKEQKHRQK